jgi:CRP-like cAMP-binding protein
MNHSEIKQTLENCEFFKGLSKHDTEKIAGLCQVKNYETGEYVFRQGDFGKHLYIIAEGHIFLERSRNLGTRKGSVIIGALGKGRVFGCFSTLLGEPHILMSSALCKKASKILIIKGADLRNMMLNNKELGFNVLERLCFMLRDRIQSAYGVIEKI